MIYSTIYSVRWNERYAGTIGSLSVKKKKGDDAIGGYKIKCRLTGKQSALQLFATAASCHNKLTASDQYLAIVLPGKMFEHAYADRDLAPENLSRTLEDTGTVTSVLIPWNTCGAYQSGVLGVSVGEYFLFAIFNWISPIMTLAYACFDIKIRSLNKGA